MVIAIIGALAGLTLTVLPKVKDIKTKSMVITQLAQLEIAINNYHDQKGFYPPCNTSFPPSTNALCYELVGTKFDTGYYYILDATGASLQEYKIPLYFGFPGFLNVASQQPGGGINDPDYHTYTRNFHSSLKDTQYITTIDGVRLLAVPAKGPAGDVNTWNYRMPGIHNPQSYDLWADIRLNSGLKTIANWK